MNSTVIIFATLCCFALYASAEEIRQQQQQTLPVSEILADESSVHTRSKRTLFLKKKVIGAGLLGLGLGFAKGYKYGHQRGPEVHHVYLSPPPAPVKYIEYVEKPVFVQRFVEKPVYKPVHVEHVEHVEWSQPDPPPSYGSW
ncbi:uncharacterized protein LOC117174983 isoform X2 [Belonocnema kinseyi]|nr:uncharacterized protein LOC117174983 isoform X2 [Belonocnema kinseyi]